MKSYNPYEDPDPAEWLALDESERIALVLEYHRRSRERAPSPRAHAAIQTVVETQVAMGHEIPVAKTLKRLQAEGLDRHEALHAIGSVLAARMYELMAQNAGEGDPNEDYWADLENLSARSWRNSE